MVHHPSTIKGLEAQREGRSLRSADLGGKHKEPISLADLGTNIIKFPTFGERVAKWFDDRKITENATLNAQLGKLSEEFTELKEGLDHLEDERFPKTISLEEVKDGIGDMAVVLAGMAHMCGMTFEECCEHAWNEIKDRTGHLNADGVFIKD